VAGGRRTPLRGPSGLVENHVLAEGHGLLDGRRKRMTVPGPKAFHVDREDLDFGIVLDESQEVSSTDIDLVADRKGIGGVEPRLVTQGGDDEGSGLGDETELSVVGPT